MTAKVQVLELKSRMAESIIGQEDVIIKILIDLLTDGNVMLEAAGLYFSPAPYSAT